MVSRQGGEIILQGKSYPYTWASSGIEPTLPGKSNFDGLWDKRIGLVLPDQASVYLWATAFGWGNYPGFTYFIKQEPQAIQIIRSLNADKHGYSTKRYSRDLFLGGLYNPHFNPRKPMVYPTDLKQALDIAKNEWQWDVQDNVFSLLAEAIANLEKA